MHVTIYFRILLRHRKRFFFYSPISGMVQRRVILFILTIHKKCKITKIVQGLFIAIIIMIIIIIIITITIMRMRRIMKVIEMSTVFKRNFGDISPEQFTPACEQQTRFRSSLFSLRKVASANPSGKTISMT